MGLPSQHARGTGRAAGGYSYSRRRRKTRVPLAPLALTVCAAGAVWGMFRLFGPAAASAFDVPDGVAQRESGPETQNRRGAGDRPAAASADAAASGTVGGTAVAGSPHGASQGAPGASERSAPIVIDQGRSLSTEAGRDAGTAALTAALPEPQARPGPPEVTGHAGATADEREDAAAARPRAQAERTGHADAPGRPGGIAESLAAAERLAAQNDLVAARALLNDVLLRRGTSPADQARLRTRLMEINAVLLLSPRVIPGDPMTETYRVQQNDSLSRIAGRRELYTHWKLIQRVNGIASPSRIRIDQPLKLVRGPFHGVVDKSDYRLDVYWGAPDVPSQWLYVMSFPVGLGADDGTPVGTFLVSPNKLENPGWVNPRNSRERYEPDDPDNPIGEYWIGLDGVGDSAGVTGYGIHGTIEPESIGRSMSMGCVRLRDEHVALAFELFAEQVSVIHIVP